MADICRFTVEIEMALEGDSTPYQAEDSIIEWIDRMMLYQIGYNEVADKKRPYVFDYDITRVENTDKCKDCPKRDWCLYEEEEDFCDRG